MPVRNRRHCALYGAASPGPFAPLPRTVGPIPMRLCVAATSLAALALAACGDSPTGTEIELPYVVSGPLDNRTGAPIPDGARVVVMWGVSSGSPDYSYVYGHGSIDRTTNRFTVTFDAPPPAEALNQPPGVGVGLVLVTTDPSLTDGRLPGNWDTSKIIGASGQHSVIYLAGSPAQLPAGWLRSFHRGYNVGEGMTIPNSSFDGFAPVAADALKVIVDDLANIDFVNWT